MENKISPQATRLVSNVIITFFAVVALIFFLFSIDRTLIVDLISIGMLVASLYLMWSQEEFDSISLLIFFFGTTACFYFFSDIISTSLPRFIAVAVFAGLSLILSNYLLNTIRPIHNAEKSIYKVTMAIAFTEIFWILSFFKVSQISKGAITAVIFFNLQAIIRDVIAKKVKVGRFVFLCIVSIILLGIVIYRI